MSEFEMFNNIMSIFDNNFPPDSNYVLTEHGTQYSGNSAFDTTPLHNALGDIATQYGGSTYAYPPIQPYAAPHSYIQPVQWGEATSHSQWEYGGASSYDQGNTWAASATQGSDYTQEDSGGFFSSLGSLFGIPANEEDSLYASTRDIEASPHAHYNPAGFYQPSFPAHVGQSYCHPPYSDHQTNPYEVTAAYSPPAPQSESTQAIVPPSEKQASSRVYEVEIRDIKGADPDLTEEWKKITQNVIQLVDDHSVVKNAMKNLFIVYVGSPTFRATVEQLRKTGPVTVRTTTPEEANQIPIAAHFPEEHAVVLNPSTAYDPNKALACLAFELTNAYFAQDFGEVHKAAPNMTAREYGEAVEKVEFQTLTRVHKYQLEARTLLKKYGFDNPGPWMTSRKVFIHPVVQGALAKLGIRNTLVPMFKDEKTDLAFQRFKGHTATYENWHRARFPQQDND